MIKLRFYRVKGDSMLPSFSSGDFVLTYRRQASNFDIGDIVIVKHPNFDIIIKRIKSRSNKGLYTLVGDNLDASSSTEVMGEVSDAQIMGKVIWHIPQSTPQNG